jgi:hypothetical protein
VAGAESKEIREIDKGDKVEVGAISDKPHWGVLWDQELVGVSLNLLHKLLTREDC